MAGFRPAKNRSRKKKPPPDLVFDPTLAFTRFAEDLLLKHAMITARIYGAFAAYVDPFARVWHGLSTTDAGASFFCLIICILMLF